MAGVVAREGLTPYTKPVSVILLAFFGVPASWSKKKREMALAGKEYPTKIDIDNIAKAVFDGLNGVLWLDDRQVVRATLSKQYSEIPEVRLYVEEMA